MIALTRLGFFTFAWTVMFFISLAVSATHESNIYLEKFVGITFLITSVLLSIWIYLTHKDKNSTKDLKEALYFMTLVCVITSSSSFLGFC